MIYDSAPDDGPLLQGEILSGIWEFRALTTTEASEGDETPFRAIEHPLSIILTAVCDLEQDYKARNATETVIEGDPRLVPFVLFCDLFEEAQIRNRVAKGTDIWRRIVGNQDERYHRLRACVPLPALFMDFRAAFALPTVAVYDGVRKASAKRVAVVSMANVMSPPVAKKSPHPWGCDFSALAGGHPLS